MSQSEADRVISTPYSEPTEHGVSRGASVGEELGSCVPTAAESRPYMANGKFVAPEPRSNIAAPEKGGAFYLAAKRVFDICFSLAVCVILAIPVAVICVAIAIDSPGKPFSARRGLALVGRRSGFSSFAPWSPMRTSRQRST